MPYGTDGSADHDARDEGLDRSAYNAGSGAATARRRPLRGAPSLVKAYVLIVTAPEATHRVAMRVRAIRHVSEVYEVMGPYDIVAEIETESLADVPGILADQIRTLDGIQSTTSLVAFPDRAEA